MEPELVVALLVLASGCVSWLIGRAPRDPMDELGRSAADLEVRAWRALIGPLVPALCALAWMLGWALVEQEPADEIPPPTIVLAAVVYGVVVLRAFARAFVVARRRPSIRSAGVVGLLAPRVSIAPGFEAELDIEERAAVLAHERAHAVGRDPLRILVANLAADLQWPAPSASLRYTRWRHALELRRDEDARRHGIAGSALAAAILVAARYGDQETPSAGVAAGELRARIDRLLGPEPSPTPASHRHWLTLGAPALAVAGACVGDPVVAWLCALLP